MKTKGKTDNKQVWTDAKRSGLLRLKDHWGPSLGSWLVIDGLLFSWALAAAELHCSPKSNDIVATLHSWEEMPELKGTWRQSLVLYGHHCHLKSIPRYSMICFGHSSDMVSMVVGNHDINRCPSSTDGTAAINIVNICFVFGTSFKLMLSRLNRKTLDGSEKFCCATPIGVHNH